MEDLLDDTKDAGDKTRALGPAVQPALGLLADVVKVDRLHDVARVPGTGEVVNAVVDLGKHTKHACVARHVEAEVTDEAVPEGMVERSTDTKQGSQHCIHHLR